MICMGAAPVRQMQTGTGCASKVHMLKSTSGVCVCKVRFVCCVLCGNAMCCELTWKLNAAMVHTMCVCHSPTSKAKHQTQSKNKHSFPCVQFVPAPACTQNRGRQEATAMCKRQGLETQKMASKNRPPQGQPTEGTAGVTDSGATACGAAALLCNFLAISQWDNGGDVLKIAFAN